MKYVPFMICVIVFIFTSAGYFITDKKTEKIYGALSIVSIACAIVQAAKTGVKQNPFTVKKKCLTPVLFYVILAKVPMYE